MASEKLSALAVAREKRPGKHYDGKGLALQITKRGTKSWIFRYTINGRERAMGLGPLDVVSLEEARELARQQRRVLKVDGLDPLEVRESKRQARELEAARSVTFEACTKSYIDTHGGTWRNGKHREQWRSTLDAYVHPIIGSLPVSQVDKRLVLKVLQPIWHRIPETASRVRQRIEAVLDYAGACEYREGENPARWKGHLDKLLPSPKKLRPEKHHSAMPYRDVPAFVARLRERQNTVARALRICAAVCLAHQGGPASQLVRNRLQRANLAHPWRSHEGREGAQRSAVRPSARNSRQPEADRGQHVCFPWPAKRPPARDGSAAEAVARDSARLHGPRLPLDLQGLVRRVHAHAQHRL